MRPADELRDAVEAYLGALAFAPELGALEEAIRYSLESGGKRIRPVLCLAVAEAAGGSVDDALPAAASIELVHTFSLIHDDLPALDDDVERRGRESTWVAFGEGVALLAGDALLAEAFRLAHSYESPAVARELVGATLGMIGGQYRDITGDDADLEELHRLKTGRLFVAAVRMGLDVAAVPDAERTAVARVRRRSRVCCSRSWTTCSTETAMPNASDVERAERLAEETAARAHLHLDAVDAETARPSRARRRSRCSHRLRGRHSRRSGYPVVRPEQTRSVRAAVRRVPPTVFLLSYVDPLPQPPVPVRPCGRRRRHRREPGERRRRLAPPVRPDGDARRRRRRAPNGPCKVALEAVGTPYRWGGESPATGFDCSGLVRWAYGRVGIDLPHSSYALYGEGRRVREARMEPGDILFFDGLGHVGLYLGNGRMVHSPETGRQRRGRRASRARTTARAARARADGRAACAAVPTLRTRARPRSGIASAISPRLA